MVSRATQSPDEFRLPDLGEGLEEAELIEWCVDVGRRVKENDTLAKMETAKALVEIPSPRGGVIAALHGKPGQAIKVGSPLVTYREDEPEETDECARPTEDTSKNVVARDRGDAPAVAAERQDAGSVVGFLGEASGISPVPGKALAAPAVRRLARDAGVDIDRVAGTGIGGRVTAHDVEAAAASSEGVAPGGVAPGGVAPGGVAPGGVAPASAGRAGAGPQPSPARPRPAPEADVVRVPFRGVRRTIAEHLRYSVSHAVHFTVMDEADVTALDHLRRRLIAASNEKISLLPFVAFAVCRVLTGRAGAAFARLNSTVDDDRQEIVQHKAVHLGIATDTDSGLMVPVIRDAHRLGVLEISRHTADLARAARERSLPPHRLSGSTFTISNFGAFAGRFGTPIINYPEAAILAVGRAREGVVVRDGMLGVGKLLPLSMSCDHRVIDGSTAATALAKIIDLLQSPEGLLPEVRDEG